MKPAMNLKVLCSFLGMVNYCWEMWPHCAHILAPLAAFTGKKTFTCGPNQEAAFQQMKAFVTADALLAFPDYSKPFNIETDASNY